MRQHGEQRSGPVAAHARRLALAGMTIGLITCLTTGSVVAAGPGADTGDAAVDAMLADFRAARFRDVREALGDLTPAQRERIPVLYVDGRLGSLFGPPERLDRAAERCLERAPEDPRCHEISGEAALGHLLRDGTGLSSLSWARQALSAWERTLALEPDNLRVRLLLLRYYARAPWLVGGSDRKAREMAESLVDLDRSAAAEARALLAALDDAPVRAIGHFETALAADPANRDAHFGLIMALQQAARFEQAVTAVERAAVRFPQFPQLDLMHARAVGEWQQQAPADVTTARLRAGAAAADRFLDAGIELPRQQARARFDRARLRHELVERGELTAAARREIGADLSASRELHPDSEYADALEALERRVQASLAASAE